MNQVVVLGLIAAVVIIWYLAQRGIHKTTYIIRRKSKPLRSTKHDDIHYDSPRRERLPQSRRVPGRVYAYDPGTGPYPGKSLNVPVPRGSLKITNESYGFPFYKQYRPQNSYDYFRPYGPNQEGMQKEVVFASTPTYAQQGQQGLPSGYSPPYTGSGAVPFYGSVNSFAPFPEINTPWEKTGLLSTVDSSNNAILNLYRKPIAPLQDLFQYSVQDKNGFIILLKGVTFLEDGDIVPKVIGKESLGPWKVNQFVEDKYIWV